MDMVFLTRVDAKLHVVIAKRIQGCFPIYDGPLLEACIYVVNQEQAFEVVVK